MKFANLGDMKKTNFKYLEEVEGTQALEFVKSNSDKTIARLKQEPKFQEIESKLRPMFTSPDRVPWAGKVKDYFYNYWTDEKNPRGLWRRTTFQSYKKASPEWEILLDLDQLAKDENENWVWGGSSLLGPDYDKCLVFLSIGGKDAKVVREFDPTKKEFVKDGFFIPEAKTDASWIDADTLYVGSDFGPGSLTDSGYPRTTRLLKRGQKLENAPTVFEVSTTDLAGEMDYSRLENTHTANRQIDFYNSQSWIVDGTEKTLIPMPTDADELALYKGVFYYLLNSDLDTGVKVIPSGTVVSFPKSAIEDEKFLTLLKVIFSPSETVFLSSIDFTQNYILLEVLDNVMGQILRLREENGQWISEVLFKSKGSVSVYSSERESDIVFLTYSDFLTPTSMTMMDASKLNSTPELIKSSRQLFNSSDLVSEQLWARSKDGTKIPYFIVHKKGMKFDGSNPTLLYGYGGFQSNSTADYLGSTGKIWCEQGGVYVLANIRGGGEFGPNWHKAGLKENRHKVFEDFIAVAEDLILSKVTSPQHLGIQGGSNGGLLVGAAFTQRPDLFNAVLCQVPLLDMLTYHTLLAGASWMGEYGDPEDEEMNKYLKSYSPFHNIDPTKKYPEVFFMTSTKDDRVHPVHARKTAALMMDQGHEVYYYENEEGGHGGTANIDQDILWTALEYTYLWKKLA